jgi:dipeptidyl aminopeptidase/acylaminoacyl peptidase
MHIGVVQTSKIMSSRRVWFVVLTLASCCLCQGQEPPAAAPKEGTLNTYLNREPTDTNGQLAVIMQNMFEQQVDTTVVQFLLQYSGRVHLDRIYFPANTSDHEMIPGYVFTPATMPVGRKLPGLVVVHGGFHEKLDWRFFRLIVEAVDQGYAVVFPEYRGSSGYGETVYSNNYGVTDTADVLASADYLAKKDYVDPSRIGIIGHSRGGMTTLLALEKNPARFQAAVTIAPLVDFLAYMSYKSEARRQEVAAERQFGGKLPDRNLPSYIEISPINHVDAVQTPLYYIGTTGDKIVPIQLHGERLIDAMKARGKTFDFHIFDNAPGGHTFIFGDSTETADAFRRSFEWLGKYLKPVTHTH